MHIILFKNNAIKEINDIKKQVTTISKKCEVIATSIHQIEDYSYQYNIKIVGMPQHDENESAEHTAELCLKLFTALGADVSMQDIDISHRIPARRQTGRPNAIVCKFVRRLAKERVFAVRKQINNINPQQLGLSPGTHLNNLNIFEHLPPRLQELLFEANKYKQANNFKFCWTRNKAIYLRKSENDNVVKLVSLEQLKNLS